MGRILRGYLRDSTAFLYWVSRRRPGLYKSTMAHPELSDMVVNNGVSSDGFLYIDDCSRLALDRI